MRRGALRKALTRISHSFSQRTTILARRWRGLEQGQVGHQPGEELRRRLKDVLVYR